MGIILTKEIRNTIESNGPDKLYMVQDFAYLNNDGLVTRALSRLEKEGVLIRLSQGIYLYPSRNKFGILRPSIEKIAYAVAEKDKARIIPSGLTALNKLGLSTQVTMNAVYLTDAAARELTIGNRKIIFKRSVPRQVEIIKHAISKYGDDENIKRDYDMAPLWIKQRLAL